MQLHEIPQGLFGSGRGYADLQARQQGAGNLMADVGEKAGGADPADARREPLFLGVDGWAECRARSPSWQAVHRAAGALPGGRSHHGVPVAPGAGAAHSVPNRRAALRRACVATRSPRTRPASSAERVWMPEYTRACTFSWDSRLQDV